MHLWQWFMVPFGLPPVSLAWAIGIGMLISFLTRNETPRKNDGVHPVTAARLSPASVRWLTKGHRLTGRCPDPLLGWAWTEDEGLI